MTLNVNVTRSDKIQYYKEREDVRVSEFNREGSYAEN